MATSSWAGSARKVAPAVVVLIIVLAAACSSGETEEAAAVRASFDGYKQAILDQDGATSRTFVDSNTIAYYQTMRDLAVRGDRETVRTLSTVDKMMVLMLRHLLSVELAGRMDGESLFVYAVEQGWIGRESVINNDIGDITVSGTHATGVHVSDGRATPVKFVFQLENGEWRIDLTSIMPAADQGFKQIIRESGLDEHAFIFTILESISGKKVANTVWDPMVGEGSGEP